MPPRSDLASWRSRQGFSQESLANTIGVSTSTVANWERGARLPLAKHRPALATALAVDLTELDLILGDGHTPPVAFTSNGSVPEWLSLFAKAEQAASQALVFEPLAVPALLQTRGYATAVEQLGHHDASELVRSRRVANRMARQAALDRRTDPLHLFAVVDESVLGREVGNRRTMSDQLDHLIAMAERSNVEVRVVTGGAVLAAPFGSFSLLVTTPDASPSMACVDSLTGFAYHEGPAAVRDYADLFEHLVDVALDAAGSAAIIHDNREQLR